MKNIWSKTFDLFIEYERIIITTPDHLLMNRSDIEQLLIHEQIINNL